LLSTGLLTSNDEGNLMQLTKMMRVFLSCMLMVNFLCSANLAMADEKPVIVIVHGAWGGGWAFGDTADLLEKKGFRVYRPTLGQPR
jgi:hypothetical protein